MKTPKQFIQSIGHAFNGLFLTIKEEASIKLQLLLGMTAIILGIYTQLSKTEWIITILCIVLVLGAEILNTSIENLADKVTKENDPLIKKTKDMAAGAVLIIAIGSLIIGGIIFIPKFIS